MVAREDGKQAKPGRPCHQGRSIEGRWLPARKKNGRNRAGRATKETNRGPMSCPRGGKTGETGPAVPPRRRFEGRWLHRGEENRAKPGRPRHQGGNSRADGCPAGRKNGRNRAGRTTKETRSRSRADGCPHHADSPSQKPRSRPAPGKQTGNLGQRERKRYEIIRMCGRHG